MVRDSHHQQTVLLGARVPLVEACRSRATVIVGGVVVAADDTEALVADVEALARVRSIVFLPYRQGVQREPARTVLVDGFGLDVHVLG